MPFRRNLHPVNSTKNVTETSGILAATTNTVVHTIATSVDSAALATTNEVTRGCTINAIYYSSFYIAEGGEVANEVPLLDWYILKNQGGNFTVFAATELPTPGSQGSSDNKRFIIHSEKGLTGGGDASLTGVPMVFKGVIRIPKGYRKFNAGDTLIICARSNFATKFCSQAIYKWFK